MISAEIDDTIIIGVFCMKKTFVLVLMLFCMTILSAQNTTSEPAQEAIVPYRLFKTTNRWTYIELETATGKMWQIQYDTQDDNRGGVVLNDENLAKGKDVIIGRFTLYPTENMWTFILLDQVDGGTWQVQWAFEAKNRGVIRIF